MLHQNESLLKGVWLECGVNRLKVLDWADRVLGESVWDSPAPAAVAFCKWARGRFVLSADAVLLVAQRDGSLHCIHDSQITAVDEPDD